MVARPIGKQRTLREEVVRFYARRLPKALPDERAGIWSRDRMKRQLDRLLDGQPVQLHRFGELDALPLAYQPRERTWTLYELRGDGSEWVCRRGSRDSRDQ